MADAISKAGALPSSTMLFFSAGCGVAVNVVFAVAMAEFVIMIIDHIEFHFY